MAINNITTIITIVILVFFLISCSILSSVLQLPLTIDCKDKDDKYLQKRKKIIKYF